MCPKKEVKVEVTDKGTTTTIKNGPKAEIVIKYEPKNPKYGKSKK